MNKRKVYEKEGRSIRILNVCYIVISCIGKYYLAEWFCQICLTSPWATIETDIGSSSLLFFHESGVKFGFP